MAKNPEPVLLELATLPREQMGPFLLLGLEKDASKEEIEAHWAERVKWARKGQYNAPLEDINWARELVTDASKRPSADASSLNADTVDGSVARVTRRFGLTEGRAGSLTSSRAQLMSSSATLYCPLRAHLMRSAQCASISSLLASFSSPRSKNGPICSRGKVASSSNTGS